MNIYNPSGSNPPDTVPAKQNHKLAMQLKEPVAGPTFAARRDDIVVADDANEFDRMITRGAAEPYDVTAGTVADAVSPQARREASRRAEMLDPDKSAPLPDADSAIGSGKISQAEHDRVVGARAKARKKEEAAAGGLFGKAKRAMGGKKSAGDAGDAADAGGEAAGAGA